MRFAWCIVVFVPSPERFDNPLVPFLWSFAVWNACGGFGWSQNRPSSIRQCKNLFSAWFMDCCPRIRIVVSVVLSCLVAPSCRGGPASKSKDKSQPRVTLDPCLRPPHSLRHTRPSNDVAYHAQFATSETCWWYIDRRPNHLESIVSIRLIEGYDSRECSLQSPSTCAFSIPRESDTWGPGKLVEDWNSMPQIFDIAKRHLVQHALYSPEQ